MNEDFKKQLGMFSNPNIEFYTSFEIYLSEHYNIIILFSRFWRSCI